MDAYRRGGFEIQPCSKIRRRACLSTSSALAGVSWGGTCPSLLNTFPSRPCSHPPSCWLDAIWRTFTVNWLQVQRSHLLLGPSFRKCRVCISWPAVVARWITNVQLDEGQTSRFTVDVDFFSGSHKSSYLPQSKRESLVMFVGVTRCFTRLIFMSRKII